MANGIVVMKDNTRLFIWDEDKQVTAADKISLISQIGDIASSNDEVETTTIDSFARTFEQGFEDNGSLEITQNIEQNEYNYMKSRKDNGDTVNWAISSFNKKGDQVLGLTGKGSVNGLTLTGISVSGLLQSQASIRVSGAINNDFVDPIGAASGIPVSKVTVSGMGGVNSITTKGGTLQCVAAIEPSDATNKAVSWSVDSEDKATISSTGLLIAKADGTVTVTATAKDGSKISGSLEVTISGQADG